MVGLLASSYLRIRHLETASIDQLGFSRGARDRDQGCPSGMHSTA
jgi:hypothetical protein